MTRTIFINQENEVILDRESYAGMVWAYEVELDKELTPIQNKTYVYENGKVVIKDDFRNERWFNKKDKSVYYPKIGDSFDSVKFTRSEPMPDEIYDESKQAWIKDKNFYIDQIKPRIEDYLDEYCDDNFTYDISLSGGGKSKVRFQANRQTVYDATSTLTVCDRLPKDGTIPYTWRARDNSSKTFISFNDFQAFVISMGLFYNKMFGVRSFLKDSLESKTIEELQNYNIQAEWEKKVNE